MNLTESVVVEVLSEPYKEVLEPEEDKHEIIDWNAVEEETGERKIVRWKVDVKEDCYGRVKETTRTFDNKEEAEKVEIGFSYLS